MTFDDAMERVVAFTLAQYQDAAKSPESPLGTIYAAIFKAWIEPLTAEVESIQDRLTKRADMDADFFVRTNGHLEEIFARLKAIEERLDVIEERLS